MAKIIILISNQVVEFDKKIIMLLKYVGCQEGYQDTKRDKFKKF